jgi:hypothetical protein
VTTVALGRSAASQLSAAERLSATTTSERLGSQRWTWRTRWRAHSVMGWCRRPRCKA